MENRKECKDNEKESGKFAALGNFAKVLKFVWMVLIQLLFVSFNGKINTP